MSNYLEYPDVLLQTPCKITVYDKSPAEEGEPKKVLEWEGKCRYSDKSNVQYTEGKKKINITGALDVKGDIAPELSTLAGAAVEVNNGTFTVYKFARPRNPDGAVHHTKLELI